MVKGVKMHIGNNRIQDEEGRTLILRGANLGGSSKNPFGAPGWGMCPESLKNPSEASFVGRPFPLEVAESHFERLNKAGLTFLRLVITWEALEHSGPGIYDEAFLAYLRKVLIIAEEKGIKVFIDPHQDVWSRWTGGDGAPAWTLEKLGIDLEKLDTTGAAITRQRYAEFHKSRKHPEGESFPRMMWPSNYNRYATATMFSLFFGGKTYAPDLCIDGENVQDWLQGTYLAAIRHCYRRLKNCSAIAGWGVLNEPHNGFIGHSDLAQVENPLVPTGPQPSPWDSIRAASGYTIKVPIFSLTGKQTNKSEILNPDAHSLFREGYSCPWKQAGLWTDEGGNPQLIRSNHFSMFDGRQVRFMEDFHKPFTLRYIEMLREADEHSLFFIEGIPMSDKGATHPAWNSSDPPNAVNAFHWYDGFALFTKQFRPWFSVNYIKRKVILGKKEVQAFFNEELAKGVQWATEHMGGMPSLLGEFGLAFDMNKRRAFKNENYSVHEEALSMYYNAVDANLLHSTIWNYTADNTNETGDGWNDEDLSIFSEGKERAVAGWKRPYPMATAGQPLSINWDYKKGIFRYCFTADKAIAVPTVIYLPAERFGTSPNIVCALRFEYKYDEQRLLVYNDGFGGEVEVKIN
jgi:hypothetical protein